MAKLSIPDALEAEGVTGHSLITAWKNVVKKDDTNDYKDSHKKGYEDLEKHRNPDTAIALQNLKKPKIIAYYENLTKHHNPMSNIASDNIRKHKNPIKLYLDQYVFDFRECYFNNSFSALDHQHN